MLCVEAMPNLTTRLLFACSALVVACGGDDGTSAPSDVDAVPAPAPTVFGQDFGAHQPAVVAVVDSLRESGVTSAQLELLVDRVKEISAPEHGLTTSGRPAIDVGTWFSVALGEAVDADPAHATAMIAAVVRTLPESERMDALQLLVGRSTLFWSDDPTRAYPLLNALAETIEDLGYVAWVLFPDLDPTESGVAPGPVIQISVRLADSSRALSLGSGSGTDDGSGSGGGGSGTVDAGVPDGGTSAGCGQTRPAYVEDPWCDEHKDDLANATIGCLSAAFCGVIADKLGGGVAANLAADGVCDQFASWLKQGIGLQSMELGPPYLQDAPKPLTALFPPIDLAQKIVSCGVNLPAAIMVAGMHHLYCFDYTSTHGQPVQYQPCQPPAQQQPGNAVCSRSAPDDPSCSASSAGQGCDGGAGTCQLGVAGSGCRCVR